MPAKLTLSSNATGRKKAKARPCALLQHEEQSEGDFLLVLPLKEELRAGLEWNQRGYWVRGEAES